MTQSREFEFGGKEVGGGGLTKYDATVGSAGADYLDVQAAITGVGGTDIKLLLITDVTEDSDITVSGMGFVLDLSSYCLTMGAFEFGGNASTSVSIWGNGIESGAEIDYTHTVAQLFTGMTADSVIQLRNFFIDSHSTGGNSAVAGTGVQLFDYLKIQCGDVSNGGLLHAKAGSKWTNIEIVGGGTNCETALRTLTGEGQIISNLLFTGTFDPSADIIYIGADDVIQNIVFDVSTAPIFIDLAGYACIDGMRVLGQDVTVDLGTGARLLNAELSGGAVNVTGTEAHLENIVTTGTIDLRVSFAHLVNVISTGLLDMTAAGTDNCTITGCKFETELVVAGDRNKFANSDFIGGIQVNAAADNNGFMNCQAGLDASGGVLTITTIAAALNTRIVGCMTNAAIVDGGTGTVVAANVVY